MMRRPTVLSLLLLCALFSHAAAEAGGLAIVGDSTKLRRAEPLPATSALFDGSKVRLRGGRGETLGLEVLTHRAAKVALTLSAEAKVQGYLIHYLEVREPSTAMYGGGRGAGAWPDPLEPVAGPVTGDALFDVAIGREAAPGKYQGSLKVDERLIPVELTVEPPHIEVSARPFVWVWYSLAEIAKAHGLPNVDAKLLPVERKYHALVRAHGAYLASDLPLDKFEARRDLMAGTRYWPVALDSSSPERQRADAAAWSRRFQALPQTAFTMTVDEPQSEEQRAEARKEGEAIGAHPKLLRAVTAAPSPDFGGAIDVFIAPASRPPHRWTYNGAPPSAGSLIIDTDGTALRTWGWIAMRYGVELWHSWEGTYFADRYNDGGPTDVLKNPLTFDQRRKGRKYADWGNGDGVLVYPVGDGVWPSLRLKALRRGLQDRELLLLLTSCGAREVAEREVQKLVPRALDEGKGAAAWPADELPWEKARGRLYDAWRSRCGHE